MAFAKLFAPSEYETLKKTPKKKILEEIASRGLVKKKESESEADYWVKRRKKREELMHKAWGTPLSIKLYERNGMVWTKYHYSFVKAKTVEKSTGIHVIPYSGFPKGDITVPYDRSTLSCLTQVEKPELLLQKIGSVVNDHYLKTLKLMQEAIKANKKPAEILRLKRYFQRYYPTAFFEYENNVRKKMGIAPIPDRDFFKPVIGVQRTKNKSKS